MKTFLLVEDDLNDAYLVQLEFGKTPELRLRHVRDGEEAIRYLLGQPQYDDRASFPMADVVLLDLKMPKLDGFEVLQWLHSAAAPEHLRLIPVIVMSGSNLPEDVQRAYALGANCYFTKPVDWGAYRERMRLLGIHWANAETPKVNPS